MEPPIPTADEERESGKLVSAFNAAAAGVDNEVICAALGRLMWQYADADGKAFFRMMMRRTEHECR
jgi:hypothetical protein